MNQGGDVLARGGRSANFASSGGEVSEFEYDLKLRPELTKDKYGLNDAQIAEYIARMDNGERFDLKPAALVEELGSGITVIDKRTNYMAEPVDIKPAEKPAPKYADKDFTTAAPILDRVLIKRCSEDKDMELLEDGSVRNKKTGLIIAAKYRQHSNVGIVLAAGQFVIIGGQKIPMSDVVRVGDRVTYGDYNSEVFHMAEKKVIALCDAVQMNYEADEEGLRIVRVQDIRLVEREVAVEPNLI
jgi:co-chaperonin GroES (HSP10)